MLKKEDCQPGVEVIAIKNKDNRGGLRPNLKIGKIYSIEGLYDWWILDGKNTQCEVIALNEIPTNMSKGSWGYTLDQFKLRRKEEFTELFKTSDLDLEKFKDDEIEEAGREIEHAMKELHHTDAA